MGMICCHECSDLDLIDLQVSPRLSAQLSKCLCELLSHTVTYCFTHSVTCFYIKKKKRERKSTED